MASDHDRFTELSARFNEWRTAHHDVHLRDDQQHTRDFTELQRRLDSLNHAHEEARRKETDFASKDEVGVAHEDLVRRIEGVQAAVGICLPRETFDAALKSAHDDDVKRDDQIANLFIQIQGLSSSDQGAATGSQRVQTLVFALLGAGVAIAGILLALNH